MKSLILFSGVSGTGKSTLSNKIGAELSIPVFSIDLIKAFFLKSGLAKNGWDKLRFKGYQLLVDLAESQLRLNQSVIVEGVFARIEYRELVLEVLKKYDIDLKVILCICSEEKIHKQRVANRKRNIEGLPEINWEYVKMVNENYIDWHLDHLTLDCLNSIEENSVLAKKYILQ